MTESSAQYIKVRSPGKLILAGEHAVVHGNPAIGVAVNHYMDVTLRWLKLAQWSFELMGTSFKRQLTLTSLLKLKDKIERQYAGFVRGEHPIRSVLKSPFELSLYTATNVVQKFRRHLPNGIGICTDSDIPTGCGMGSSAACVVGLIRAISALLDLDLELDEYLSLGIESENLQHGHSSGLDVNIVYHGGCQFYENKRCRPIECPTDWPWQLVHTGVPSTTTGECVIHTSTLMNRNLLAHFRAATEKLADALGSHNLQSAQEAMSTNHELLTSVGVVPDRVQTFITACNQQGLAAKICGAGSIHGDSAGMVLVLGHASVQALCEQFGYSLLPTQIETRGAHAI